MSDRTAEMIKRAHAVMDNAYAPYSNYHVGVCIRTGDKLFVGCNVENVSYSVTLCGESVAIGCMIAAGYQQIDEMVIMGSGKELCTPCGACRQRIMELAASPEMPIHLCDSQGKLHKTITIDQLLPGAFNAKHLEEK